MKIWTDAGKASSDPADSENNRVLEETLSPETSEYSEAWGVNRNIAIEYETITASRSSLH